jgi:hypothetical protein
MRIVKLTSNNILRLDAVEIEPDGSLVIVGGMNEQGKTSVLDSILLAMGGRAAKHTRPLKDGTEKGKIEVELDDLLITRTYTQKGTALKVTTKDKAAAYSSPQKMLDKLTGALTFDPLAWCDMDRRKQLDVLKGLVGLDFTTMDEKRRELFEERTAVNRQLKDERAHYESMPGYEDAPDEEVSVTSLLEEINRRRTQNELNKNQRLSLFNINEQINGQERFVDNCQTRIEALEREIQEIRREQKEEMHNLNITLENKVNQQKHVDSLVDADEQEIVTQIQGAEGVNNEVRAKKAKMEQDTVVCNLGQKMDVLTAQIAEYDEEKKRQLSAAEFPVDGLSFDEDGVLFGGIPFEQASSAQKLRVSVAMGLALNPDLKVLLIRDGSLLDENNLKLIAEMVEKAGAQIWIERVGKGEECHVIIEDGKVKSE